MKDDTLNDYSLLDFGDGRRLERFGTYLLDRLCPAAEGVRKSRQEIWCHADFRFEPDEKFKNSERGRWTPQMPSPWTIDFGSLCFELHASPFGHVGVFPEQRDNWRRIEKQLGEAAKTRNEKIRVLNLFAYTGGSSLAAHLAGTPAPAPAPVEVVHVDSSKSAVDRARRNAELSGISSGIRFIVEDVRKFVRRELVRGNRYDAVILDPPSYGHGVKGEPWRIFEHLPALLENLVSLLSEHPVLLLLTAHTPGLDAARLRKMLLDAGWPNSCDTETFSMEIPSETGRPLPAGHGVFAVG